ncbi:chitin binding peritrophin-A, putative [Pediculus humanus corporis]|uniref:Chitin binding peritrophin-A, putative n=1 Tax=Pediculus humanus subsp. corporis TaxID=121224 RepID=E0VN11_PEDHC|nr:chitin binding peritrophin-A, putative [Pediculus humanus corporis]EEB14767.1 chitin binding peritrophin-A, putative [Pediculus humanus corporis]
MSEREKLHVDKDYIKLNSFIVKLKKNPRIEAVHPRESKNKDFLERKEFPWSSISYYDNPSEYEDYAYEYPLPKDKIQHISPNVTFPIAGLNLTQEQIAKLPYGATYYFNPNKNKTTVIFHKKDRHKKFERNLIPKGTCKLYLEFLRYAFEKLDTMPDASYTDSDENIDYSYMRTYKYHNRPPNFEKYRPPPEIYQSVNPYDSPNPIIMKTDDENDNDFKYYQLNFTTPKPTTTTIFRIPLLPNINDEKNYDGENDRNFPGSTTTEMKTETTREIYKNPNDATLFATTSTTTTTFSYDEPVTKNSNDDNNNKVNFDDDNNSFRQIPNFDDYPRIMEKIMKNENLPYRPKSGPTLPPYDVQIDRNLEKEMTTKATTMTSRPNTLIPTQTKTDIRIIVKPSESTIKGLPPTKITEQTSQTFRTGVYTTTASPPTTTTTTTMTTQNTKEFDYLNPFSRTGIPKNFGNYDTTTTEQPEISYKKYIGKEWNDNTISCPDGYNVTYPLNGFCHKYVHCESGVALQRDCPNGLQFNIITKSCDMPHNSYCNYVCPVENGFYGVPGDCGGYFICKNSISEYRMCPPSTHWNTAADTCIFAEESTCPMKCSSVNEIKPYEGDCKGYIICSNGFPYYHKCPLTNVFDPESLSCIPDEKSTCSNDPKLMTNFINSNAICRTVQVKNGSKSQCGESIRRIIVTKLVDWNK